MKLKSFEAKPFRIIKPYSTFHGQFIPFPTTSNGSDIETNANESFKNGVFFDIEAMRARFIVNKLFWSEAKTFHRKKLSLKQSKHI